MAGSQLPNTINREIRMIAIQCLKLRSLGLEIEGDGALVGICSVTFMDIKPNPRTA